MESARDLNDATPLTPEDRAILDFERSARQGPGAKEQAIREELGLTTARYYQVLGRVIQQPAAIAYDPMLVGRLQRMRQARLDARISRTRYTDAD